MSLNMMNYLNMISCVSFTIFKGQQVLLAMQKIGAKKKSIAHAMFSSDFVPAIVSSPMFSQNKAA